MLNRSSCLGIPRVCSQKSMGCFILQIVIFALCSPPLICALYSPPVKGNGNGLATPEELCLPWTYRHSENSTCECGNNLNGQVECNITTRHIYMYLYYCYCMTYDSASGNTFAGYCTYSTYTYVGQSQIYLPMDGRKIDIRICARWKRTGILCSQCLDTYGVSLYTYDCQCIKCEGFSKRKVLKFLAVAFLPLTVICIIITMFHINILHPPWSAFVFTAQILSAPPIMQGVFCNAKLVSYDRHFTDTLCNAVWHMKLGFLSSSL